ncbi:MAG TPA: DUF177 domain-containing protein [Abditibacteriaceae bacterium]|jgi:uncharacterized protein
MYVDLTDILRAPGSTSEKPINIAPGMLDDIEVVEPIHGWVRVTNARQSIVVEGRAQGSITMQCARCLESYSQPVELELEANAPLSYFRGLLLGAAPDADEEDEPDDELAAIFDANSLDVLELVRQAIVLQSPRKPLCSPDCPGLPEAAKYMSGKSDDARWESLKDWNEQKE